MCNQVLQLQLLCFTSVTSVYTDKMKDYCQEEAIVTKLMLLTFVGAMKAILVKDKDMTFLEALNVYDT